MIFKKDLYDPKEDSKTNTHGFRYFENHHERFCPTGIMFKQENAKLIETFRFNWREVILDEFFEVKTSNFGGEGVGLSNAMSHVI